jgi:hypothetical protein
MCIKTVSRGNSRRNEHLIQEAHQIIEGIEGCEYFVRMLSALVFGVLYPSTEHGMLGLLERIDQGVPTRM